MVKWPATAAPAWYCRKCPATICGNCSAWSKNQRTKLWYCRNCPAWHYGDCTVDVYWSTKGRTMDECQHNVVQHLMTDCLFRCSLTEAHFFVDIRTEFVIALPNGEWENEQVDAVVDEDSAAARSSVASSTAAPSGGTLSVAGSSSARAAR